MQNPPPCPPGFICRLPPSRWGQYWKQFPDGSGLTSDVGRPPAPKAPCGQCGEWFDEARLLTVDKSRLGHGIAGWRCLICRDCSSKCKKCHSLITTTQRWKGKGLCKLC